MSGGKDAPRGEALHIEPLRDHEDATIVGRWIYQEWARFEGKAVWRENRADLQHSLDPAVAIPRFFVGLVDGERVGCASIVPHDLPTRPDLGPWLANILVLPDWRRRGFGRQLARAAMDHACRHVPVLYLYTFDQVDLYRHLGWTVLEQSEYSGRSITLMQYRCTG
jgi:GNAT superfamily N-acetyltransferase